MAFQNNDDPALYRYDPPGRWEHPLNNPHGAGYSPFGMYAQDMLQNRRLYRLQAPNLPALFNNEVGKLASNENQ